MCVCACARVCADLTEADLAAHVARFESLYEAAAADEAGEMPRLEQGYWLQVKEMLHCSDT
jgi:hypothetical protein